jgi:hypothetical protein
MGPRHSSPVHESGAFSPRAVVRGGRCVTFFRNWVPSTGGQRTVIGEVPRIPRNRRRAIRESFGTANARAAPRPDVHRPPAWGPAQESSISHDKRRGRGARCGRRSASGGPFDPGGSLRHRRSIAGVSFLFRHFGVTTRRARRNWSPVLRGAERRALQDEDPNTGLHEPHLSPFLEGKCMRISAHVSRMDRSWGHLDSRARREDAVRHAVV